MTERLTWELGWVIWVGLALAAAVWGAYWRALPVESGVRRAVLASLRAGAVLAVAALLARPVRVLEWEEGRQRKVAVVLDRSRSMGFKDVGTTRWEQGLRVIDEVVVPAVRQAGLVPELLLFDQGAEWAGGTEWRGRHPEGVQSDLGLAVEQALIPPDVDGVLLLSDGAATRTESNTRAAMALMESGIPLVAVGVGSETGERMVGIRKVELPPDAAPKQGFQVQVQLETSGDGEFPGGELLLYRDGLLADSKKIPGGSGARSWLESFAVREEEEGLRRYRVELQVPEKKGVLLGRNQMGGEVRIAAEKEFRVLFVQGALTWDFKFLSRALADDPVVKMTGLSRTSEKSVFRQNVAEEGELENGFPDRVEDLSKFRVVVLSGMRPTDFLPAQQEALSRFCRELGGGVLLVGGAGTFGGEWQGSILEKLLPVRFDRNPGVRGVDQPFHLMLTPDALRMEPFQIVSSGGNAEAWARVPAFDQYGSVAGAKPGALVLAEHERDVGPEGRRILMAAQRFGAGRSVVLCVQNFWRWRLAKDAVPEQFDRFWRQLLRWIGEGAALEWRVSFPAQNLRAGGEIRAQIEYAGEMGEGARRVRVQVQDPAGDEVLSQELDPAGGLREIRFRSEKPGDYRIQVVEVETGRKMAERSVEAVEVVEELQKTARDMETLRQWAALGKGEAYRAEDLKNPSDLAGGLGKVAQYRESRRERRSVGLNAWVFCGVLILLLGEWALRRRWNLL